MSRLLGGQQRPRFTDVHRSLTAFCERHGFDPPSRATLYNAVDYVDVPAIAWSDLPGSVRRSLYNLDEVALIPGDIVVFYAFNYGVPRALSFASGLPWLCLLRAERRLGWRPKSRGLLRAVMTARGLG